MKIKFLVYEEMMDNIGTVIQVQIILCTYLKKRDFYIKFI